MKSIINFLKNTYIGWGEPIYLVHFLTYRCNAHCKHCFIDFSNPKIFKNELSLKEIQKISQHLGNSLVNINLTGGEPFLRPDIFEIAQAYFKNSHVLSLYLTTNGAFTEEVKKFIEKFLASKIKGKLIFSISIDDFEIQHDKNRGVKGLFKKAIKTYQIIKNYKKGNLLANVNITITPNNYDQVVNLYKFLKKKYKVDAFTASLMREEGVIKQINQTDKMKIIRAYRKLSELINQNLSKKKISGFEKSFQGRIMNSKNLITYKILSQTYSKPKFIATCPAGALFGVIYPNGDVYPCEILSDKKIGNLRNYNYNFQKLWQSRMATKIKKFIKKTGCNCTYECALSTNIVSHGRYLPPLLSGIIKSYF